MEQRNFKLKVGQEVIVTLCGGNITRGVDMSLVNIDNWCFDGEVTSVGRKYIKVKFQPYENDDYLKEEIFVIENDYTQKYTYGCANYKIYLNKQEVMDKFEKKEILGYVRSSIGRDYGDNEKLSLDQLRRIKTILEECE